ncbi:Tetratricopeptide repeat [Bacteroides thetaiotaomicron]|uniref:TPR domain protein n=1 Tax=Bacteroides thetaiotaomicron (strain ATCC 29148 / DSM 2079 / JCM 5827 / CCUG 10774 / NCTC 10582 / VPI-5482 / E50) TaxID=226186 RepID=Q8A244_BACTN|nr:tetratricopeptide repeat protein [Bacteroides thetaiotaomicron]AAO78568.1 TPR domain protein [Bacteroides thetaiotaomicron VPI-5482]MBI0304532.1 tetratricopeptide repeat protein [Bacteroides thetaiotaomicron]MBM6523931.1 tetratricopeptide repeat protein [Bacteroides thetaiotaomicron]MCS2627826.1 tetratricopeptide repeat protein [Bacteroides thetaiotaomicron]MCS2825897.1 tetratricopeptide repeat protein [Bacteroides thetaiotaomicron]
MNKKNSIWLLVAVWTLVSCGTVKSTREKPAVALAQSSLTSEQQRKYDYFFLEAMRLKEKKDYASAFGLLQHCLDIHPNAASALYEVSQYYMFLRQVPQGQEALEKAVANAPDNYWYSQGLASLYQQQNELDKAITLLEQMVVRFPAKQDPLFNLLDLYGRQEKYDKVISTLNRLEKHMGKNEQLSMEKFRIYLQMKDDKKAFQEIESLVQEYPMDMRYQVILGDVYLQNGKKQEAYDVYQKVLAAEPDNPMAIFSMASYYKQTGQEELYQQQLDTLLLNKKVTPDTKVGIMRQMIVENEQADKDSTQIIALFDRIMKQEQDDPQIPMLYAQYLLSKNMEAESVPVLEQVVDLDPTNNAARMMLIGAAVKKEDYKQIIKVCEPGIEATPDALEFYYYLAVAYNQAEKPDSVISICKRALEHKTADGKKEIVSEFYSILGDMYHTQKQMKEAYAAYDSALVYNPSNIGALNNYAYYLSVERRDLDKAEEMSYKTVKAEPNNATYLDTYAWILFEKGNYAEARIYIDNAMKSEGGDKSDVIVEHCGDIYYMTGDVDGALTYWKKALEMGSESKTLKQKIEKKKYIAE